MPLHLLGKKSWNVYNTAAIERVRKDEADAKAREEAAEQRMQEEDASSRIAILRGGKPLPPPESPETVNENASRQRERERRPDDRPRERKRRRLGDENETDAEIRFAREDDAASKKVRDVLGARRNEENVSLVDGGGHIQLVPVPDERDLRKAEKNAEYEAEKAKKRKREEDQYTMRFSNAAGYSKGVANPWYAAPTSQTSADTKLVLPETQGKGVWGNEDPRRVQRDQQRIASNDPFAMMQAAQRQLKQREKERAKWQAERDRELEELKREEEQSRKREWRHRRHHNQERDEDALDGFSLNAPLNNHEKRDGGHDREKRHRHQHRHHSRERRLQDERDKGRRSR
jgi:hypothetical protein